MNIIKLCILKKGSKYLTCELGRHKAKLIINEVSGGLAVGDCVEIDVINHSTSNRYGSNLVFESVRILFQFKSQEMLNIFSNKRRDARVLDSICRGGREKPWIKKQCT